MYPGFEGKPVDPRVARELRLEIEEFNTEYGLALDRFELDAWPEFFTEDAVYRITGRENADAGLPVGLVWCDSKAMLRDRAFAIKRTTMFAPRYMQHFITNVRVMSVEGAPGAERIRAQANYMLLQTLVEGPTTIHQSGRYFDVFVRGETGLLLAERQCVYDTLIIANDLVYPV